MPNLKRATRVTRQEKFLILSLLIEGKTVIEVCSIVGRTKPVVHQLRKKYLVEAWFLKPGYRYLEDTIHKARSLFKVDGDKPRTEV